MSPVAMFFLLFALALANWGAALLALRSFLASRAAIASPLDLEAFAALARRQMLQALLQSALLIIALVLGLYLLASRRVGLVVVLVLNGVIWAAGRLGKELEERARSLKVLDPLLEERYRAICRAWVKKPFPDF